MFKIRPKYFSQLSSNGSFLKRTSLFVESSFGAIRDPTRQDLVAAVGELTAIYPSAYFLRTLRDRMLRDPSGRDILKRRPILSTALLDTERLSQLPEGTFGREYAKFMIKEQISADTRAPVRYIEDDDELAYVMLRYRQVHDFMHTLTGVSTTLGGELALKWFEYYQTKLPMNLLAGVFGPLRLLPGYKFQDSSSSAFSGTSMEELSHFYSRYLPWAIQAGSRAKFLLCVKYEDCLEMDLHELREHLNIIPFVP